MIAERIGTALVVIAAAVCFFGAIWIVTPAPTIVLLAIGMTAAEFAPHVVVVTLIVLVFARALPRGSTRQFAVVASACALVCAVVPLWFVPATIRSSDAALDAVTSGSPQVNATESAVPFDIVREFLGGPTFPIRVAYNVPYFAKDGTQLDLDLYHASKAGPRPTVVLIHGGAWQYGSRAAMRGLALGLAHLGYTAIAVDYRYAPRYRFPTQPHDIAAALAAIAAHATEWNVDRNRVAIVGESAGAELALLAAYEPGPIRARAAIGYYTPLDFAGGYEHPPQPDPLDVRAVLRAYLGGSPAAVPAAYKAASPRSFVAKGLPPTLLVGGDRDELVVIRYQREMTEALRAAGVTVASLEFPWSNHGFAGLSNGVGGQLTRYYTERFLAATIGR